MKASQIFNFRDYVGVTALTGLISLSAMAEVSHPAKLSQQSLAGAAFDDPSTIITEVEGEKILDYIFVEMSNEQYKAEFALDKIQICRPPPRIEVPEI